MAESHQGRERRRIEVLPLRTADKQRLRLADSLRSEFSENPQFGLAVYPQSAVVIPQSSVDFIA